MRYVTGALVFCVLLIAVAAWVTLQWNECRSMGFSVFYCVQHVL